MLQQRLTAPIVMLIDDILIGADIQDSLEALGYTVSKTLTTVAEAQAFTAYEPAGVVLVDMEMRGASDILQLGKSIASGGAAVVYLADNDAQIARVKSEAQESGWVKWPFDPRALDFEIQLALQSKANETDRSAMVEAQPF